MRSCPRRVGRTRRCCPKSGSTSSRGVTETTFPASTATASKTSRTNCWRSLGSSSCSPVAAQRLNERAERARQFEQAAGLVEQKVGDPELTLARVAEQLAVSPRHRQRVFAEQAGMGWRDYLDSQRMDRARAWLEDPALYDKGLSSPRSQPDRRLLPASRVRQGLPAALRDGAARGATRLPATPCRTAASGVR